MIGKKLGEGNTATVYEYGENRVIKLFHKGYSKKIVEKELFNNNLISNMDFKKPKAYELVNYKGRLGIIFDKVPGISLQDWVMKTSDVQGCAIYMAKLHKDILKYNINNVTNYKEFLELNIRKATSIELKKCKEIERILDTLPDGDSLCHGDFHPGNIFISNGVTTILDFMNICHGPYLYDVARTVFLIEYTPLPDELENKKLIIQSKKMITNLYLKEMKVSRDMIKDYLKVIIAARKGEMRNDK